MSQPLETVIPRSWCVNHGGGLRYQCPERNKFDCSERGRCMTAVLICSPSRIRSFSRLKATETSVCKPLVEQPRLVRLTNSEPEGVARKASPLRMSLHNARGGAQVAPLAYTMVPGINGILVSARGTMGSLRICRDAESDQIARGLRRGLRHRSSGTFERRAGRRSSYDRLSTTGESTRGAGLEIGSEMAPMTEA